MRCVFLALFFGLGIAVTRAGTRPLSNKEIGLMLRSGYSSDAILAEISSRRVLEPLDDATMKSLVDYGAKKELVAALQGNAFLVNEEEASQVKQREAELAAQRAALIERDREQNTLLQARAAQARAKASAAPPPNETPILEALKPKLVRCRDGSISGPDGTELEKKKLIAIYYSAHWCGPCRKFTPQLVEYYNRVAPAHPEFELIFVSSDRSRFNWETYIHESRMPWLAIDYDQLAGLDGLRRLGGNSIPSLIVLDGQSRVIASSYDGEKYLGPGSVLAALDQIFAGGTAAR